MSGISVVIPLYNKAMTIERAVRSALAQSVSPMEIIVIDDCSSDDSAARLKRIPDPRVRLVGRTSPGPGGYAARNLGLRLASGEWVAFLDADDYWDENHLASLLEAAEADTPVRVVASGVTRVRDGEAPTIDPFSQAMKTDVETIEVGAFLAAAFRKRNPMKTSAVFIHRSCVLDSQLFPEQRTERSGDLYAWVKLVANCGPLRRIRTQTCVSDRDSSTVSRMCVASLDLPRDMVEELCPKMSEKECYWVRRYANKMIKDAWLEGVRLGLYRGMLIGRWVEGGGRLYKIVWNVVSLFPARWINGLRALRGMRF
ncbi:MULTISPECIES: glycosyltransferase family A protein [unclassified Thioalkalivibrio]|uniref:glycosyltransferase family 2 protein n=1 Tax=unclassified Thioalkalivibrio TaxID=2621013 RepID=UPI0009DB6A50|nr:MULTISPECIES: glycosyltransferase family A protein [unclassified Thioalkalivibrio]